jgi:hypothetical protein
MSVERALSGLLGDRAAETTVREVLNLFALHPEAWFGASEVARRVERSEATVAVILSKLSDGLILVRDSGRYRLDPDPVVDLDVRRFLRKSEAHNQLAQNNLAKFRDRFGHY